ncbi:hypothetical protein FB45DRAFT_938287, partial [Roridomyces roridus]
MNYRTCPFLSSPGIAPHHITPQPLPPATPRTRMPHTLTPRMRTLPALTPKKPLKERRMMFLHRMRCRRVLAVVHLLRLVGVHDLDFSGMDNVRCGLLMLRLDGVGHGLRCLDILHAWAHDVCRPSTTVRRRVTCGRGRMGAVVMPMRAAAADLRDGVVGSDDGDGGRTQGRADMWLSRRRVMRLRALGCASAVGGMAATAAVRRRGSVPPRAAARTRMELVVLHVRPRDERGAELRRVPVSVVPPVGDTVLGALVLFECTWRVVVFCHCGWRIAETGFI